MKVIIASTDHQHSLSKKSGRHGDPRMNKAVAARITDPKMSLLDALLIGGFEFNRNTGMDGNSDSTTFDSENVSLRQRKNQLSRRLRTKKNLEQLDEATAAPTSDEDVEDQERKGSGGAAKTTVSRPPPSKKRSTDSSHSQQKSKRRQNNEALAPVSSGGVGLPTVPVPRVASTPTVAIMPETTSLLALQQERLQRIEQTISNLTHARGTLASASLNSSLPIGSPFGVRGIGLQTNNQNINTALLDYLLQNSITVSSLPTTSIAAGLQQYLGQQFFHNQQGMSNNLNPYNSLASLGYQQQTIGNIQTPSAPIGSGNIPALVKARLDYAKELFDVRSNALMQECLIQVGFSEADIFSSAIMQNARSNGTSNRP